MHVLHEEMQILFACALPIEMLYKHDLCVSCFGTGSCGLAATVLLCVLHFAKGSMLSCPCGCCWAGAWGSIPDSVSAFIYAANRHGSSCDERDTLGEKSMGYCTCLMG